MAWQFNNGKDADDYLQSIALTESLIHCRGLNLQDLRKRFRSERVSKVGGGLQFSQFLASQDLEYQAKGGISTGAAMKVMPLAAFYGGKTKELCLKACELTRLLHNSPEAQLSAVLTVLRWQQIFYQPETANPWRLWSDFEKVRKHLDFGKRGKFFAKFVRIAWWMSFRYPNYKKLVRKLAWEIGLSHLAWTTPIVACFWSYRTPSKIDKVMNPKLYTFRRKTVRLKPKRIQEYRQYLSLIGEAEHYFNRYEGRWRPPDRIDADIDTFWAMVCAFTAAERSLTIPQDELIQAKKYFGDKWDNLAKDLLSNSPKY